MEHLAIGVSRGSVRMSDTPGHGSAPKCSLGGTLFFVHAILVMGFVSEGDLDDRPPIKSLRGKSALSRMFVSAVSDRLNPTLLHPPCRGGGEGT